MNQLTGRFVVIVLSIRDGRGFNNSQNLYYLEATLNGRKIISDPVEAQLNPVFCTELVWEIEKKEIRKLRSSHVPLRIECFTVDNFDQREKIGFVLLHLRSARPVPSDQILLDVDYKWNRLLGVHTDFKASHPELALALTIRDKLREILPQPNTPMSCIHEEPLEQGETVEHLTQDVSILYLEEGFIQIGDGEDIKETFTLSFLIETAFNLDLLLSKSKLFQPPDNEYYITVTYFDLTINTKSFCKDLQEPVILNDKIMFKLHSNVSYLSSFFEAYKTVKLNFCQGTDILATTEIDLKNFNTKEFFLEPSNIRTKCEQDCLFRLENGKTPEGATGRKPFVSTQTALVRNESKLNFSETGSQQLELIQQPEITHAPFASGDQNYFIEKEPTYQDIATQKCSYRDVSVQTSPRGNRVARSALTSLKDVTVPNSTQSSLLIYEDQHYHLYSLTANFQNIVWKRLQCKGFQFKFKHPKANTALVVQCNSDQIINEEPIILEDVKCVQYFVSTPSNISTLVYTYPPKITICNDQNANMTEEFELYTKLFLSQSSKIINETQSNCSYYAMIASETNEEEIACEVQVDLCLTDCGTNPETYQKTCYDLEPLILDERLAFKTLNELETWKKEQQKLFQDRQKCMEAEKLKMLKADWEKKRSELEHKLKAGIEKCRVLSEELIFAAHELEGKKKAFDVKLKYQENPELIEMQVTKMMEEEMNIKMEAMRKENIQLLERINKLHADKDDLNKIIEKRDMELDEQRRTTLTGEQTSGLLQELRSLEEKYRQEQNAKNFFKEQWQKAVREVHMLKSEDQKQIQMQIRKKKDELSQFSLNDFDKMSSDDSTQSLMSCPAGDCSSCVFS